MRVNLKDDDFDWALGLDEQDHFKLIGVAIPADNNEVLRDQSVVAGRHKRERPRKS